MTEAGTKLGRAFRMSEETRTLVSQAYQPIVRGYFLVAALYYAVMSCVHVTTLTGADLANMLTCSSLAVLLGVCGWFKLRSRVAILQLELITLALSTLVVANVLVALHMAFSEVKLVYFIVMSTIFALASASMRQASFAIVAVIALLVYETQTHAPQLITEFGFIAFASALCSIAIAFFLRRSIAMATKARMDAEASLVEAQSRLEKAGEMLAASQEQSLTDSLTGLTNRRGFFAALEEKRPPGLAWLILLDLDRFKMVNDNYGHFVGDELLRQVAHRLRQHASETTLICRMGGDEFSIIHMASSRAEIVEWANGLIERLAEPVAIGDRVIQIGASLGCHQLTDDVEYGRPIQQADYALLEAKRAGRNRVVIFSKEHASEAAERFRIEQELRNADLDKEINLLFQPQVDPFDGRMVAVEALARWQSPVLGALGPDRFVSIAEDTGLIGRITLAVMRKAIASMLEWENQLQVSINLSGQDLMAEDVVDRLMAMVRKNGINPRLLEFEVTETAMMPDIAKASANLHRLAAEGHAIALDDFGTGYSNFSTLRNLPISKLKIDRSFMENLEDPMTEKVLRSLVGMARTLDVTCLMEGIETFQGLMIAKRVGIERAQGYYFSKPLSADQIYQLVMNAQKYNVA